MAAELAPPLLVDAYDILALDLDRATGDASRSREEPDQRAERHRLARARLADEAERLPALHLERGAVDRAQDAARKVELDPEVGHAQQRLAHSGLSRSARPSARSERPSAVTTTAIPGTVESSQCVVRNVCPSAIIVPQSGVGGCTPRPR